MPNYSTIAHGDLAARLETQHPDNEDRRAGFALVNVLGAEAFEKEHIPGSINIPRGQEGEFDRRFDKSKEIVVYCASSSCDASPKVAQELAERGFENVRDYEAGLSDWKEHGHAVEGRAA